MGGGWVDVVPVSSHAIILARSVSKRFDIPREGSKGGVGEDVGMLVQDKGSISLERLLCECPVCHGPQ